MMNATPPGFDRQVYLAGAGRLLHYPNGEWRFYHVCDRQARGAGTIVCAPLLDHHAILVAHMPDARVTVTPSILCPDCGTHGWVNASRWTPA